MKERNKYILLGFSEFLLLVIGLLVLNHFDTVFAFIMAPFFIAMVLIDFKLLNMILKKIDLETKLRIHGCDKK